MQGIGHHFYCNITGIGYEKKRFLPKRGKMKKFVLSYAESILPFACEEL
jgi:hypothetical protein